MRRPVVVTRRGPGLLGTMARTAVVAGTATAVAGGVSRAQQGRANQAVSQQTAVSDLAAQQQQLQAQQEALAQQQQLLAMQQQQQQQQQQQAKPPEPAAAPPTGAGGLTTETMARLQQLADLQQQGILTPEEFAREKAKILGQ